MRDQGAEEIDSLRRDLAEISTRAFNRGLVSGAGGNISVRVPDTDKILITPSGVSLGDVEPEINILLDLEGAILEAPPGLKPSKEVNFHLAAYRTRPDVMAVAHLHPPFATAFSNKGKPLPLVTVSSRVVLKDVPWVESALPGSRELYEFVCEALEKHPGARAMLMKEHGVLTLAADLKTAYYLTDLVEDTAKIAYIASHIS
ncbi:MAG: class II aldolase/adducin family protein [Thermodesulfobacteriota bacterium]